MKNLLVALYLLCAEIIYIGVMFFIAYFFVKFFWNKERVEDKRGKIKILEHEKPNKRRVSITLLTIVSIIFIMDIICSIFNMSPMVAKKIYPFGLEEGNKEGLYPRVFYNIQICGEGENQDVKFNILCYFNSKELEQTKVRDELKKNKTTYFEDKKNEVKKESQNIIENKIENIVFENIIENKIENEVSNTVKNVVVNNEIKLPKK